MGINIECISISDLHIGNNRISPEIIHRNLKKYLYPELNSNLDILFISGDMFHTLLSLNSSAAYISILIINELIELSKKYDFLIRVLKGTFEHDRDQNKYFLIEEDNNVKVFNTMSIEYIEKYDIYVGYVPDDLPYKNAQIELTNRIKEFNIEKLDILVMHGYCRHEIPKDVPIEPVNLFDIDFLMNYVKGPILKGHIHSKSIYKTCVNNGSFDRWCHGQEEKKGYFKITYTRGNNFSYKFIENKDTCIFKTITISNENITEHFHKEMNKIIKEVTELTPLPLHIRIACTKEIKNKFNPYDFEFKYQIRYTFKILDSRIVTNNEEDMFLVMNELPNITRDNLSELIENFIESKLPSSRIEEILKYEE